MYSSGLRGNGLKRLFAVLGLPVLGLLALPRTAFAAGVWPVHLPDNVGASEGKMRSYRGVEGPGPAFRSLALVTVLSILALVTLGGVVRLTGSGLGCPDWPLCHGKVVPQVDTATLIEYSHRLMSTVVGLLVLATALIVWRSYRRRLWLLVSASAGFILLVIQVLLGGFTVMTELSPGLVIAHLATAEALMASMVVVCMVSLSSWSANGIGKGAGGALDRFPILMLGVVLAAYALLLTGSYVAVSGATASCGQSWPLCQGQLVPEGYYPAMHMLHRVVALLVGLLIATVLVLAWRRQYKRRVLRWTVVAVGALFLAQVLVGASVLWMGFPLAARLMHLSLATLVWMGLAALAVLAYTSPSALLRTSPASIVRGLGHA